MINIDEIIRQLTADAEAMRALVQSISAAQAQWKPNPDTWCMKEVMEHVYNEERLDFRLHLKEYLSNPPHPWGPNPEQWIPTVDCRQALEGFLVERQASLVWLKGLSSPDWEVKSTMQFGPSHEEVTLSAGDVLVAWVAHDYLHIRQMNELLFAWNEQQAAPYSVQYAGGW
jgi:hypothetical protein